MNKTVLITGASKGIGSATAIYFAEKNYNVILNYHSSEQSAKLLQQSLVKHGHKVIALPADVSNPSEVQTMVKQAIYSFGGIDVLVNNAGIAEQKLFTDITDDDWNRMLSVNLGGVFHCCRAVLPHMISQKCGSIINISSIWGIAGASCEVHYSAAKAGVIGLTKALAKEVGPSGIRVNCVAPGVIDTSMNNSLSVEDLTKLAEETPLGRVGTAFEVAKSIYFLSSDDAEFITGQVLSPNGGLVI